VIKITAAEIRAGFLCAAGATISYLTFTEPRWETVALFIGLAFGVPLLFRPAPPESVQKSSGNG